MFLCITAQKESVQAACAGFADAFIAAALLPHFLGSVQSAAAVGADIVYKGSYICRSSLFSRFSALPLPDYRD